MRNVNYKSDFDFIMRLKGCADATKSVPFPDCDFDAMFWTSSKTKAYIASCKGGVCTNCFRTKDGDMHFVFDNQHMGLGTLHWEPHFELPNDLYPDSIQDLFRKASLDIKLVDGDGDCPTTAEVELIAPFIKGDKGDKLTYADLTEEDKADFFAPIKQDIDDIAEKKADREDLKSYPTNDEFNTALKGKQDTLATSVDMSISDGNRLSLTDRAKQHLFDDLFSQAGGEFVEIDHTHFEDGVCKPYCLNGIWLTYGEALAVYDAGPIDNVSAALKYCGAKIKTNLPPRIASNSFAESSSYGINIENLLNDSDIEVLNLTITRNEDIRVRNCFNPRWNAGVNTKSIHNATKLKKILGVIDGGKYSGSNNNKFFGDCPELVDFQVKMLCVGISFAGVPKMSAASLSFMIEKRYHIGSNAKKPFTITLHPDTYAKIVEAEESGNTDSEWSGIIDLAASKNITLASA